MKLISLTPAPSPLATAATSCGGNALAVFIAQQILQQNPYGEGQAPDVPDTLLGEVRETEIIVIRGADAQFRRGAKAVFCHWFDYI